MDWSRLQHEIPFEKNFRWRGGQVSRLEALADAVFALSITLLVVSTEVPGSYELIGTPKALPASRTHSASTPKASATCWRSTVSASWQWTRCWG